MKIYNSFLECIGKTPMIKLNSFKKKLDIKCDIYAKVEMLQASGSIKIRPVKEMLLTAIKNGEISENTVIIEPTSGNTGIALALVCACLGYKFIAVMPENMSVERQKLIKAYGAKIVLTDKNLGMKGALDKALLLKETFNGFIPSQFENESNPLAHYKTTAKEIYSDMDNDLDIVICGIGTGGTISGIGKYLKEKKDNIKIIGVEPKESNILNGGTSNPHKIEGIGANFIPKALDLSIIDEIIDVEYEEALKYVRILSETEGIFAGISSGATLAATINYINKYNIENKKIVVILPDTGERYLSTEII